MIQVHLSGKVCKSCVTVPASKRSREQPAIYLHDVLQPSKYRKIPKISHGAYIFKRPFFEELIFGGAYLWREICVSKSIGLALQLEVNLPFLLCFTLYLRAISNYNPPGRLYLEGRFNGGFFPLRVSGAYIWRGLYIEGLIFGILRYLIVNSGGAELKLILSKGILMTNY